MKKYISALAVFLLVVLSSLNSYAQNDISISGIWADSNSASFQNCYALFSQDGESVYLVHYLEFNGTGMVEHGFGKRVGNKVEYEVKVTKAIPGWSTSGKHTLYLSPDGNTLRGTYVDAKGNEGPIVFKRVK
ncbi:MAG TPA: hypothetical protein VIK89_11125 [Cytophagaceae bacterium]